MRSLLRSGLRRMGRPAPVSTRAPGPRQASVIAVAAQKGGVGKTTTSVSLAAAMARHHGKRTLLIDLDPQGHVHTALSQQVRTGGGSLASVLTEEGRDREIIDIVARTEIPDLHVTPFDPKLSTAEDLLGTRIGKELILREALRITRTFYDLIVIDCPPNLGNLTINGLVAADQVLIPCDPSPLALNGVHSLIDSVSTVAERLNPELDLLGILMTRVDGRNRTLNETMLVELRDSYGPAVLPVQIGINNTLAKAQHAGQDVFAYDAMSRGAQQYAALAEHLQEVL